MFRPIYDQSFWENLDQLEGATLQGIQDAGYHFPIEPLTIKEAINPHSGKISIMVDGGSLVLDTGLWLFEKNEDGTMTFAKRTHHSKLFQGDPTWTRCTITLAN
jgi:hypothetical protein